MFKKTRRKYASKFGKIEHSAGRLLGLILFIGMIYSMWKHDNYQLILWVVSYVVWMAYIISHTLEKKIYGKHGFR